MIRDGEQADAMCFVFQGDVKVMLNHTHLHHHRHRMHHQHFHHKNRNRVAADASSPNSTTNSEGRSGVVKEQTENENGEEHTRSLVADDDVVDKGVSDVDESQTDAAKSEDDNDYLRGGFCSSPRAYLPILSPSSALRIRNQPADFEELEGKIGSRTLSPSGLRRIGLIEDGTSGPGAGTGTASTSANTTANQHDMLATGPTSALAAFADLAHSGDNDDGAGGIRVRGGTDEFGNACSIGNGRINGSNRNSRQHQPQSQPQHHVPARPVQSPSSSPSSVFPSLSVIVPGPALVGDWALITR